MADGSNPREVTPAGSRNSCGFPTAKGPFSRAIGLGLLLFLGASADAQQVLFDEPLSPRIANYEIDVQLLPESRTLKGKQVLTWYNKTGEPISELQFHLHVPSHR